MSTKLKWLSIVCLQFGAQKLSVIWSSGVSAIHGVAKVLEGQLELFVISRVAGVCCEVEQEVFAK